MTASRTTTDHEEIRSWTEERGGHPAKISTTGDGGILRIDFGEPEEGLEEISWEEFFDIFDRNELAFLFQNETEDGQTSRFNKFVERG